MFGMFSKKQKPVPVTDLVWMNEKAKKLGLLQVLKEKPGAILCAWFDETAGIFEQFLKDQQVEIPVYTQRQLHRSIAEGKTVIFLEHYPLFTKEQEIFASLSGSPIIIFSSFEEPLLQQFGGDRIQFLMRAMGGKEEEPVSHKLISLSLHKAQQKLEKKIAYEQGAVSMTEWFRRNLPDSLKAQ